MNNVFGRGKAEWKCGQKEMMLAYKTDASRRPRALLSSSSSQFIIFKATTSRVVLQVALRICKMCYSCLLQRVTTDLPQCHLSHWQSVALFRKLYSTGPTDLQTSSTCLQCAPSRFVIPVAQCGQHYGKDRE